MRVLLVNTSETIGGAAIAAGRLLQALVRCGVDASLLVRDRQTDAARVSALPHPLVQRARFAAERLQIVMANGFTRHRLFDIDTGGLGADITRLPEFRRADVVHLHWVNQGMLSLADIGRIAASGKRVVWTMHDMWPFTGVCHHADTCTRWLEGCGRCPLLRRSGPSDLSRRTFEAKRRAYAMAPDGITFVACSNWLAGLARRSPLLERHRVESIPNPIDTDFYSPGPRLEARRRLALPEDKLLLLFVAYKVTSPAKGIDYLRDALAQLADKDPALARRLALVAVGREATQLAGSLAVPVCPAEYVSDPAVMADYYRAADALVMPTLMDNLPNTIAEAMACATPVVGFEVGGLPQMIDHGHNGLLVRYRDAGHLADSIGRLFGREDREAMARAARHKALAAYSEEAVAARFVAVYSNGIV